MGENSFNSVIARNIRYLLSQTDMSDNDLARASNISKSTLSRILNCENKKDVDRSYIGAIAAALGVSDGVLAEEDQVVRKRLETIEKIVSETVVITSDMEQEIESLLKATSNRGVRERAWSLKVRGMSEYQRGKYQLALHYYTQSAEIAKEGRDEEFLSNVVRNKCEALLMLGKYTELESFVSEYLPAVSDSEMRSRMLFILGSSYYKQEEYAKAQENISTAITLVPKNARTVIFVSRCHQLLGTIYQRVGDFDNALHQSTLAVDHARGCNDAICELYGLRVIAEVHADLGNIEFAIRNFRAAHQIAEGLKRQLEKVTLSFYISYYERDARRLDYLLDQAKQIDMPPRDLSDMFEKCARLSFEEGNYKMGQVYYEKALNALRTKV